MSKQTLHANNIIGQVEHRVSQGNYTSPLALDLACKNMELFKSFANAALFNSGDFNICTLEYLEQKEFIEAHFNDVVELIVWSYPEGVRQVKLLRKWYAISVKYFNEPKKLQDTVTLKTQEKVFNLLDEDAHSLRTLNLGRDVLVSFEEIVNRDVNLSGNEVS